MCFPGLIAPASLKPYPLWCMGVALRMFSGVNCPGLIEAMDDATKHITGRSVFRG